MPAATPEKKKVEHLNGSAKVNGELEALREQVRTRFMRDPDRLAAIRSKARSVAKKTLMERRTLTESEIDAIEEREE